MALQAHDDFQSLLVGQLVGVHQGSEARRIDAQRLLHEHVLAGLDRRRVLGGPKAGRGGHDDQMHVARHRLLVGFQAGELTLRGHVDPFAELAFQHLQRAVDTVLERVRDRHDLDGRIRLQAVRRRPGASAAAADDRHADFVVAGRVGHAGHTRARSQSGAGDGQRRGFQKIAAGRSRMSHGHSSRRLRLPAAASSPAGGILTAAADESNSPQTPTGARLVLPCAICCRQPVGRTSLQFRRTHGLDRPSDARCRHTIASRLPRRWPGIEQANSEAAWATWASGKTLSVATIFSILATLWPINALCISQGAWESKTGIERKEPC